MNTITVCWETYDCSNPMCSPDHSGGYEYFDNMNDATSFVNDFNSNNNDQSDDDVWYHAFIVG